MLTSYKKMDVTINIQFKIHSLFLWNLFYSILALLSHTDVLKTVYTSNGWTWTYRRIREATIV